MLLTKEVEICADMRTAKLYEDKGYVIPKWTDKKGKLHIKQGTKILVKVEDLSDKASVLVDIECEGCNELLSIQWRSYIKHNRNGRYYCHQCANAGFKKWVSFYDWCYENLPKEEADIIMLRWDYDLNIDKDGNIISPKHISRGSSGLNQKGYWFKCLDCPEHESEQKNIIGFTNGHSGRLNCHQCNKIIITHPYLIKYLVNEEDAYKYSYGEARIKIPIKCPDCGYEKGMRISDLIRDGFGCPKCSTGYYPEKFMFSVFEQLLGKDFIFQLSKTTFKWCGTYKYDFYIDKIGCVCESHGFQHYEDRVTGWGTLEERQENDKQKELLAKNSNIEYYIVIDCRKSEMEWIKNGVMESWLPKLLNFKEDDINWLKCHEYACSSMVKMVCNLYNNGIKTPKLIAKELKIGKNTATRYLHQGEKLGWCDYDSKIESKDNLILMSQNNCKQVICLTTGEIFESIISASKNYKIIKSNISMCCSGKAKSAGKHPETGEKMVWMYYEKYLELNK